MPRQGVAAAHREARTSGLRRHRGRRYTPEQASNSDDRFVALSAVSIQTKATLPDVSDRSGRGRRDRTATPRRCVREHREPPRPGGLRPPQFHRRVAAGDQHASTCSGRGAGARPGGLVFYLITHKLILSPVRDSPPSPTGSARASSTRGRRLHGRRVRGAVGTFNSMLENLQRNQDDLHSINTSLDVKLTELSEANTALYEAATTQGGVSGQRHARAADADELDHRVRGTAAGESPRPRPRRGTTRRGSPGRYLDNIRPRRAACST